MKKTLYLTIKWKWFKMIRDGIKTEDYREIKKYWISRLIKPVYKTDGGIYTLLFHYMSAPFTSFQLNPFNDFDKVVIINGRRNGCPKLEMEFKRCTVKKGKRRWGAPDDICFTIELGKILSHESAYSDCKSREKHGRCKKKHCNTCDQEGWLM